MIRVSKAGCSDCNGMYNRVEDYRQRPQYRLLTENDQFDVPNHFNKRSKHQWLISVEIFWSFNGWFLKKEGEECARYVNYEQTNVPPVKSWQLYEANKLSKAPAPVVKMADSEVAYFFNRQIFHPAMCTITS